MPQRVLSVPEFLVNYLRLYGREYPRSASDAAADCDAFNREKYQERVGEQLLRLHKAERDQHLPYDSLCPDDTGTCITCGASPIVPVTGMCGPCTFGEAETLNGNW